eukprot:gene1770-14110_t
MPPQSSEFVGNGFTPQDTVRLCRLPQRVTAVKGFLGKSDDDTLAQGETLSVLTARKEFVVHARNKFKKTVLLPVNMETNIVVLDESPGSQDAMTNRAPDYTKIYSLEQVLDDYSLPIKVRLLTETPEWAARTAETLYGSGGDQSGEMTRHDYILTKHIEEHTLLCMLSNGSVISLPMDLDVLLGVKVSEFSQRRADPVALRGSGAAAAPPRPPKHASMQRPPPLTDAARESNYSQEKIYESIVDYADLKTIGRNVERLGGGTFKRKGGEVGHQHRLQQARKNLDEARAVMDKQRKAGQNTSTIEGLVDYWQREMANFKRMSAQIDAGSGAARRRSSTSPRGSAGGGGGEGGGGRGRGRGGLEPLPSLPPAPPHRNVVAGHHRQLQASWEWMDDLGIWVAYPARTAKTLDDWFIGWSEGEVYGIEVVVDTERSVNVQKMVQINKSTRKERKVRRVGGRQPSAEDAGAGNEYEEPGGAAPTTAGQLTLQDIGKQVLVNGFPGMGTIRFLGPHHEHGKDRCGVEMDQAVERGGDGIFGGRQYFKCAAGKALLVMLKRVTVVAGSVAETLPIGTRVTVAGYEGCAGTLPPGAASVANKGPQLRARSAGSGGSGEEAYLTVAAAGATAAAPAAPAAAGGRADSGNATYATYAPARSRSGTSALPDPLEILDFSVDEVSNLLRQMNLASYIVGFQESQVDGDLLMSLDHEMLESDLGVTSKLHRTRLLKLQGSI